MEGVHEIWREVWVSASLTTSPNPLSATNLTPRPPLPYGRGGVQVEVRVAARGEAAGVRLLA